MEEILLSICISSYNRGSKCVQLIKKILSLQDERFNIFVCDDCSEGDTVKELKKLVNSKVFFIQNKENIGACKNWYNTIDCGTGKYILHVLDRDDLYVDKLKLVLDILENNNIGAGYFGKTAMYLAEGIDRQPLYSICKKGREAFLTMAGVAVHPTGFIVERKAWKQGQFKKFFYQSDKYGIYPHSYVLSELAVKKNLLFSPIPFYYMAYRASNNVSRFYEKDDKKEYWWMPNSVIKTDSCLMLYCYRLAENAYREEFICRRFRDGLNRATFLYKKISENQEEMEHYGFCASAISPLKLLLASIKYQIVFSHLFKKLDIKNKNIKNKLITVWLTNLKIIIGMLGTKRNTDRMLSALNHNLASFRLMNQWVKIKQNGKNLSEYFEKRGYRRIAVYGMGYIGETLIDELKNSNVKVVYGIDRNASTIYSEVNIIFPNEIIEPIDVIVVTVVTSYKHILMNLSKEVKYPIISLKDVVYDI